MNFKEKYINEMESVKPYNDLDVSLLRAINRKEMTVEKNKRDKNSNYGYKKSYWTSK